MTTELNQRNADNVGKGHPKGLWNLSLTELWERFSYYGLQGTLTYYLLFSIADGGLGLVPATAVGIVGAYGACVYLAQIPGAWLADRVLSPRSMILAGGTIIMLGHITLALIPSITGLVAGLALISAGTGALKTSITTVVGLLYDDRPVEDRDAGFTYFYMSISLGAVTGMLCVGFTQSRLGFHVAFGLAAIGMAVALIQYRVAMRTLPPAAGIVKNPVGRKQFGYLAICIALVCAILAGGVASGIIRGSNVNLLAGFVIVIVFVGCIVRILSSGHVTPAEKRRTRGFVPMWIAGSVFVGLSGQVFTTVPLLVTERIDMNVGGWEMPGSWLAVIGSIALIVISPLSATALQTSWLGRTNTATKYSLGIGVTALAYFMLTATELWPGRTVPAWFVAACLVIAGLAEVLVGPIGLALATRVAPRRFQSQLVALQILTLGAGATIYGALGVLYTAMSTGQFFFLTGVLGVIVAVVLATFSKPIEDLLQS
ncbi:oligopeptide:H+ symporter [Nocardia neocaledoniensis]|uniref:peptide MFS transporter n=1 Tax=Nocardia neocaledoniensis TaxID=236511 RepID=UPI0033E652B9